MRALLTGATGLVGDAVLRRCLDDSRISAVVSLGRRRTGLDHPKLTEIEVADFADLSPQRAHLGGVGVCFHCLAAYRNRVGGAAYERVTVAYLAALLAVLKAESAQATFCYFGAEGTRRDGKSWVPALNVKGRAERMVIEAGFPRRYFFRPAYICPSRPRAHPVFYDPVMKPLFRLFPWLGISSADLARAMVETALTDPRAEAVLENREMRGMAARLALPGGATGSGTEGTPGGASRSKP
ncbi:MAG TPA: hypothetical protein VLA52_02485 [Thermohalobaculum sp.]|nr:hypothetical protein [Thermohalobaculum sp.]